jgi:hypothetical protein
LNTLFKKAGTNMKKILGNSVSDPDSLSPDPGTDPAF